MSREILQDEIRKRFTLNWLIQGASQHAGSTAHYLVRDELNAIDSRLVRLYDQLALIILIQYWRLQSRLLMGGPSRFWYGPRENTATRSTAIRYFPSTVESSPKKPGNAQWDVVKRRASRCCHSHFRFRRHFSSSACKCWKRRIVRD